ncbi:retrovirus-related pol polyprotein from transposon TNT 1-94 [Tanacetum coccineum]
MFNHITNWDKANNESKIANESLTAKLERYKKRVKILEQRFNDDLSSHEKFIDSQMDDIIRMKNTKFATFEMKIDTLKQTLSKHVKEKESLLTTLNGFKMEFNQRESKSIDKEIINPTLYDGNVLSKTHDVFPVVDEEETLILDEAKLVKKNDVYIELSKRFSNLEQHCISLEVAMQLNKEIFQKDKSSDNQNDPEIQEYCEQNDLKAQLQAKDTVISKLKETIHSLRDNVNPAKVKKDIDEIETINIELEHNLKAQILKKATTIAPGMFKFDLEPLAPKVLKNKDAHLDYIKHYMEHTQILWEIVESAKALSPLDSNLDSALTGSTGASGSKPTGNTKNNRISQSSSCNKNNKVEDQSRSVKSRKNKKNRVAKTDCNDYHAICVVQIVLWYMNSGCSKHMTRNRSQLINFVNKFLGTVKFGNDQIAKIMGYGDYQIENVTISKVYYVKGLGHNLFSVGQFCDSDHEVAFRKHTCFVRNLEGVDLLMGSRGTDLYTLSIGLMIKSSLICLLSKASKTKSWLWHRRLSHLNFGTINQLAKQGLVRGLPKLKFEKDHLCSACSLGKSKKQSHKPKSEDTNQEKLYLLHMDLCGPMHVESINEKKYILVIVDDYSRFTWVKFLRSKDEAPEFIIKFLKMIQVRLNATIKNIRTDNGTEFVNQTLRSYYEDVSISHETSVARTP